jgi:hypothetical protein
VSPAPEHPHPLVGIRHEFPVWSAGSQDPALVATFPRFSELHRGSMDIYVVTSTATTPTTSRTAATAPSSAP